MNEQTLLLLYAARDEQAIAETKRTCGRSCLQLAKQILGNDADAEECLADTLLAAWQHIPPDAPDSLQAYLLRITRNKALHLLEQRRAEKRGGGEGTVAIDELAECLPGGETPEDAFDRKQLRECLRSFVNSLPKREREIFLRRYFFADSVKAIASRLGVRENAVSKSLARSREKLRRLLKKENEA